MGFNVSDVTGVDDNTLALVAHDGPPPLRLFPRVTRDGIGPDFPLESSGNYPYGIQSGTVGELWLSGSGNERSWFDSSFRDACLARYDLNGTRLWEKLYGGWASVRIISGVTPLADGSLLISGINGWRHSWIAKLNSRGTIEWEHRIGAGKGVGIALLPDGKIAAAAIFGSDDELPYREHAATWILDQEGRISNRVHLRDFLNNQEGAGYGLLQMTAISNGAYVMSGWMEPSRPEAPEIARLDSNGTVLWTRQLPETVVDTGKTWKSLCRPVLTSLPNDDALVACSEPSRGFLFFRLAAKTGHIDTMSAPFPRCQKGKGATGLFLAPRSDGTVWVVGSQRPFNGSGCVWLGYLTPPQPTR
jgi:hypothetical protein